VQLHRKRERQRRLRHAKRAFTLRWRSVTGSIQLPASAAVAAQHGRLTQRTNHVPPQAGGAMAATDGGAPPPAAVPAGAVAGVQPRLPISPFQQPKAAAAPNGGPARVPASRQQEEEQVAHRLEPLMSAPDGPQMGGEPTASCNCNTRMPGCMCSSCPPALGDTAPHSPRPRPAGLSPSAVLATLPCRHGGVWRRRRRQPRLQPW
jgi:hypothetical protein